MYLQGTKPRVMKHAASCTKAMLSAKGAILHSSYPQKCDHMMPQTGKQHVIAATLETGLHLETEAPGPITTPKGVDFSFQPLEH